jgi:hypothetical protein
MENEMAYQAIVFQVMIASPGDVAKERQIIKEMLQEWNYIHSYDKHIALLPVGWETHSAPLMGERPQAIINKQILGDSDLLIAVFWTRIGTPTGEAISGTVEEIEKHIASGKPTMLYFSTAPAHPDSIDPEQYKQVKAFKEKCISEGLVETYDNLSEFKEKLVPQLAITLNKNQYIRTKIAEFGDSTLIDQSELITDDIRHPEIPTLSEEAKVLIIEASQDNNGVVMRLRTFGGTTVQTNGKQFAEQGNRRSEAAWEAAVDQLENYGFLEDRAMKGEVFFITHEGYQIADYLQQLR